VIGERSIKIAGILAASVALISTLGAQSLELKEIKNAQQGYSLSIPSKSDLLSDDSFGTTYSQQLGNGEELLVSIAYEFSSPETMDEAIADATMMGSKDITEKRIAQGGVIEIVKKEVLGQVEVWYFARIGEAHIRLKCAGPMRYKDLLLKAARTLKASR
jgi:hypothetical protein